jgi:NAD(P)-dependent dehydrogenase (short-subunit alcohol dehydrogenase family)
MRRTAAAAIRRLADVKAHDLLQSLFTLEGKVAIVTGASAGIGRAMAALLAQAGASVVVAARNAAAAEEVAAAIVAEGGRAIAVALDVADEASVVRCMAQAAERLGRIDILVNNAGVFPAGAILDTSGADWDAIFHTNLRGSFLCLREAAKAMRDGGQGGRIINISSNASIRSSVPDRAAYNASKAAVNRLTADAALELAPYRILVNAVLPGPVATEKLDAFDAAGSPLRASIAARVPLGRWGSPEEIAAAVIFLAARSGDFITGQTLVVDGGAML